METISTLIEFAEKSNPQGNVTATGDFISVAIILAAVVFAIGSFIFVRMQNKSLVTGKHVVNNVKKNPLIAIFVILAGFLLAVGLITNVSNAIAGPNGIASASEKVYAYVDTETGEVTFENGYIKSNVPADVNSVAVDVDLLDSAELTYNFNWQVKIGDEVIYNGVAQDLKHDFYIDVKDAQTSFEITNLSVSDANALIGKEVAKISFCATTLKKVQSDSYFVIYDEVKGALADISEIPETSLLDEDRAAVNASISQILDTCLTDISSTEDPSELQAIVNSLKSQIATLVNDAKATAEETVADKQAFITEQSEKAASLKTTVTNSDLLTAEDKDEFNSQIDVLALQDIPYINSITSRAELSSQKADITSRLDTLDAAIKARIEERFKEYKDAAYVAVIKLDEDGKAEIDKIDNLSEAKKASYKAKIGETAAYVRDALDIATTKAEIDSAVAGCTQSVSALIAEAKGIAYRPWNLETWKPVYLPSVAPNGNYIFDTPAAVSDTDPYYSDAPAPTYHIKDAEVNANYFSIETTLDSKAQINVDASTPEGEYPLTIYATFDSVMDKGYKTNTNEVNITVSVWAPRPVAAPSEDEIVLGDYVSKPLFTDGFNANAYALSDGGSELKDANAKVGDTLNFYLYKIPTTPSDQYWILELWGGHWNPKFKDICEPGYPQTPEESRTEYDLIANNGIYSVELTQEMLDKAYEQQWWGGSFVLNGDNIACARVTLKHAAPTEKTLWEGEQVIVWNPAFEALSPGATELLAAGAQAGDYVNFYIDRTSSEIDFWRFQVFTGQWTQCSDMSPDNYDLEEHGKVYSLLLTEDILQQAISGWSCSFNIQGENITLSKITLGKIPY